MRWVTYRRVGPRDSGEGREQASRNGRNAVDRVGPGGGNAADRVGLVEDGRVHGLPGVGRLVDLLGDDGERLSRAADRARAEPDEVVPVAEVQLLAPVPRPPSVRDFSSFEEHLTTTRRARGLDMPDVWYEQPVFYFSNPAAVVGPGAEVALPPGCRELDFELEVAAILGRGGRDLDPDNAERHIAGYCVMNDWSARDIQRREMTVQLGPVKGKDFATTLGPWLVTPDELPPGGRAFDLTMTATVNGREYSRASLAGIHWSFGEMVAYASRGARLEAGDVLGSGTAPTGCILELAATHGTERYPWLRPGDEVTLEVERLGSLTNRIVGGPPLVPLRGQH